VIAKDFPHFLFIRFLTCKHTC